MGGALANHLRCGICGRNTKIGNEPPGRIRIHRKVEICIEPYTTVGDLSIHHRKRTRFTKNLCPASGLTRGDYKRLLVTWQAFHDQK